MIQLHPEKDKMRQKVGFSFCRIYFLNVFSIFGHKPVINSDLDCLKPLILLALFIQAQHCELL